MLPRIAGFRVFQLVKNKDEQTWQRTFECRHTLHIRGRPTLDSRRAWGIIVVASGTKTIIRYPTQTKTCYLNGTDIRVFITILNWIIRKFMSWKVGLSPNYPRNLHRIQRLVDRQYGESRTCGNERPLRRAVRRARRSTLCAASFTTFTAFPPV